jgi:hypothetical protein
MCRVFNCWWVFPSSSPSSSPLTFPCPLVLFLFLPQTSRLFLPQASRLFLPHDSSGTLYETDLLIIGVEKGYYQFTSHLIAELIRVVSKGSAPGNNLLMDILYSIIALVSLLQPSLHAPRTRTPFPLLTATSCATFTLLFRTSPAPLSRLALTISREYRSGG